MSVKPCQAHFASIFQSAEALHKDLFDSKDVTKKAHNARVVSAVSALEDADLNPDVVAWAKGVLSSRNDKPLWRRIEELVAAAGPVGQAIVDTCPDFAASCAGARTGVSHGGGKRNLTPIDRHWLGDVLRWVVRTHLLMKVLGDPAVATQIVAGRHAFRHAVKQLA